MGECLSCCFMSVLAHFSYPSTSLVHCDKNIHISVNVAQITCFCGLINLRRYSHLNLIVGPLWIQCWVWENCETSLVNCILGLRKLPSVQRAKTIKTDSEAFTSLPCIIVGNVTAQADIGGTDYHSLHDSVTVTRHVHGSSARIVTAIAWHIISHNNLRAIGLLNWYCMKYLYM